MIKKTVTRHCETRSAEAIFSKTYSEMASREEHALTVTTLQQSCRYGLPNEFAK
jgi:hypothetical protein